MGDIKGVFVFLSLSFSSTKSELHFYAALIYKLLI